MDRKIFVVDDDLAILTALKRLLSASGFTVSTFPNAAALLDAYDDSAGCLIIDLSLPDLNGLHLQRRLLESGYEPAIVFLTGTGDIPASVEAMKEGAVDFLTKPVDETELLRAVDAAFERDGDLRRKRKEMEALMYRWNTLSEREKQVFQHVVKGEINKEIALQLNVVEKTIKVHRARVIQKMGAQSLPDLVRMSERLRLGVKGE